MEYKPYPKALYSAEGETKIVHTEEEHAQAGKGWKETFASFLKKSDETPKEPEAVQVEAKKEPTPEEKVNAMSVAELRKEAISRGFKESDVKKVGKEELTKIMGVF